MRTSAILRSVAHIYKRCLLVALIAAAGLSNAAVLIPSDHRAQTLWLLLEAQSAVTPAGLLGIIKQAQSGALTSPEAIQVYERFASPVGGDWLVQIRYAESQIEQMTKENPSNPELMLQRFVLLDYGTSEKRIEAQRKLMKDPMVLSVTANIYSDFATRPNDFYVNTGPGAAPARYQWALEAINYMSPSGNPTQPAARDLARGHAYIAIVDSGIFSTTADYRFETPGFRAHFSQAFYAAPCSSWDLRDVDELGVNASPTSCRNTVSRGHGTHIAGIIGATNDNTLGVAGICRDCSLLIFKTRQQDLAEVPESNTLNGFISSYIRGAQVINRSAASSYMRNTYGYTIMSCAQLLPPQQAVDAWCLAISSANIRDVLVVASSGNHNDPFWAGYPAAEASVFSVAGTNPNGTLWVNDGAFGSNLGKVEFVAPAKRVVSTFYPGFDWTIGCGDSLNNAIDGSANGFDECTGTSMSAPHIAGIAGVMRSTAPLATVANIKTAMDTGPLIDGHRQPDMYAAVNNAIALSGSVTPMFALLNREPSGDWNRYFTTAPQMAVAGINGLMLPTPVTPPGPIVYIPDPGAPPVPGYAFPGSALTPTSYFKVYTRPVVGGVTMLPLYRFSKLQDEGFGTDACGNPPPVPAKPKKIIHYYATNDTEKAALMGTAPGTCFKFDGIEGYVAPFNTGGLQALYRATSLSANAAILVPSSYLGWANALGFTTNQSVIGWVPI